MDIAWVYLKGLFVVIISAKSEDELLRQCSLYSCMNCILNQNVLVTTLCSPELTLDLWVLSCFCTVVNNRTENYILRYQVYSVK